MTECIFFDLDGTLADSKMPADPSIIKALQQLLKVMPVAITTGGRYDLIKRQVLQFMPEDTENLYLLPVSGTQLCEYGNGWELFHIHDIPPNYRGMIKTKLNWIDKSILDYTPKYGSRIDDRGGQITFSMLGQNAPIADKQSFDRRITEAVAQLLKYMLAPEFDVLVNKSTSIDITMKGYNKAYGVRKLLEHLSIPPENAVYIGDHLSPGGNDYPVQSIEGMQCIEVSGWEETLKIMKGYL